MKKIFSLVCSLVLVLGANAGSPAQLAATAKKAAPVKVEQVQFEPAQIAKLDLNAAPAMKATHFTRPAAPKAAAKKIAAENANVDAAVVYYDDYYGDYYMYLANGSGFAFSGINPVKDSLYTYSSMVADYTGFYDAENEYAFTQATDATLKVSTKDGLPFVVGTMTLTGGASYTITYQATIKDTVTITASNLAAKSFYYGGYEYTFSDAAWTADLVISSATQVTGKFGEVDATYSCVFPTGGYAYSDGIAIAAVMDSIVVSQVADTTMLTGAIVANNGTLYILDARYEKPAAKEITLAADTMAFTLKLNVGFFTIGGYNADSTLQYGMYFASKGVVGQYTEKDMDAYSTWVDEKEGKKTLASYQNLSAADIVISRNGDTIFVDGTLNLATNKGQEAIVTVSLYTIAAQEWGEWADYAPFELNTGKYYMDAFTKTFTKLPVQTRKDNYGAREFKLIGWGAGYFSVAGTDLVIAVDGKNVCSITPTPFYSTTYGITDADLVTGSYGASTFDAENGQFNMKNVIYNPSTGKSVSYSLDTLWMDKPVTKRDTVDIVSTNFSTIDYLESYNLGMYYATDVEGYSLFRVASDNATSLSGTFTWADTTISSNNSYFQITGTTTKNYFQDGEFTVNITEDGDTLTGWMIGEDEKYYRLNWTKKKKWDERDTIRLSAQGITIEETTDKTTGKHTGWLYINQSVPGYDYIILQSVGEPKYGTFSYADKTLGSGYYNLMPTTGTNQQFQSGSITVGEVGDSIVLDGICIGDDEKAYVLHFAQANKVLNYDTDAPFDANYAYNEMEASIEEGVISIYARNDSTGIGLELYADPAATTIPAGVYTIDTTKAAGTALQSVGVVGGYLTKCYAGNLAATGGIQDCFFMVSGTITLSYDEYGKLNVAVNALNSYDQPVTATVKYTKLTAKDTVQVRDVEFFIGDEYQEDYGVYYYEILDGMAIVGNLFAYTDTIFGDFKDVIDFGDCVLYDQALNKRSVIDVDIFTVYAEGKNMTLTAKVLGSDTILYDIVATGYLGGLLWDAQEDCESTFAYETITLTQATKAQVMINAGSSAIQDTVVLVVNAKLNKSGKLAKGEYTEVMASTGLTEEYQITPSFTGNTSGNWYIQSGKLTVNEDESMVFVGVNSYDKNVTINFGAKPTALKEVNANETIVKFFDGNKIVIRKGDKLFNILGEEL